MLTAFQQINQIAFNKCKFKLQKKVVTTSYLKL